MSRSKPCCVARKAELSVEGVLPSMLRPCPFQSAATADCSMSWQLSRIWSWDDTELGPLGVFLPIGLYGVYMAVFSLSMWTMSRDGNRFSGVRWVVVITFVVVTLYIAATLVSYPMEIYSGAGHMPLLRFYFFALAWCHMSPCICCSLSDSVLAWRCYVIFGKRRWLKWTLTTVILFVTVIGIVSWIIDLLVFWKEYDGQPNIVPYMVTSVAFPTTLIWAVCSLILNTVLSTSIVTKIVIVSRQTSQHLASSRSIPLARAFIESSLISWIALAVYTGLYTSSNLLPVSVSVSVSDAEYALQAMLPLIFSISQALVIARLGVSRFAASASFKDIIVALTSDNHDASAPRSRAVAWRDGETWNNEE